jgi:hypothetical protein
MPSDRILKRCEFTPGHPVLDFFAAGQRILAIQQKRNSKRLPGFMSREQGEGRSAAQHLRGQRVPNLMRVLAIGIDAGPLQSAGDDCTTCPVKGRDSSRITAEAERVAVPPSNNRRWLRRHRPTAVVAQRCVCPRH